jgi:hypothetical protein
VTENNDENYNTTNNNDNDNAWPSGSPYCPASPVDDASLLVDPQDPANVPQTKTSETTHSSASSSIADEESSVRFKISIMIVHVPRVVVGGPKGKSSKGVQQEHRT